MISLRRVNCARCQAIDPSFLVLLPARMIFQKVLPTRGKVDNTLQKLMPNDWTPTGNPKILSSFVISFPLPSLSAIILSPLLIVISTAVPHAAQLFAIKALFLAPALAQILLRRSQKSSEGKHEFLHGSDAKQFQNSCHREEWMHWND
jgi:hypothetical protein